LLNAEGKMAGPDHPFEDESAGNPAKNTRQAGQAGRRGQAERFDGIYTSNSFSVCS